MARNPLTRKVNGTLTCDAFPRKGGRYEVVCSLVKPSGTITFASHGTVPGKEAAEERIKEVISAMKRNPFPKVCAHCGAKIYTTITPVKCPHCGKPWKDKNPTLTMPVKSRKQLEHLFTAQSELAKGGVTFDSGSSFRDRMPITRDWELDWSLKGAKMKNPRGMSTSVPSEEKCPICGRKMVKILVPPYIGKYKCTYCNKIFVKKGNQKQDNPVRYVNGYQWGHQKIYPTRERAKRQARAIYASGYRGRNPATRAEKASVGAGMALLFIGMPLIIGLVSWLESRNK